MISSGYVDLALHGRSLSCTSSMLHKDASALSALAPLLFSATADLGLFILMGMMPFSQVAKKNLEVAPNDECICAIEATRQNAIRLQEVVAKFFQKAK